MLSVRDLACARIPRRWRGIVAAAALACLLPLPGLAADPVPQDDMLDAVVWMQTAPEYRANCLALYALAKIRLDEALADKSWTAYDQTGDYPSLPPAVILDLDETAIDNSAYEAGLVARGADFDPASWDAWVKTEEAKAIPGAVDFTNYAAAKGVRIFYVSNRTAAEKAATARNLQALGFPLGGPAGADIDTLLMQGDRPEWSSGAKAARFAHVARAYRVLLMFGDNLGDFTDRYRAGVNERDTAFDELKAHFGHDWMMLANPAYGSWEGAPYGHDRRLPDGAKRAMKRGALTPWSAPP